MGPGLGYIHETLPVFLWDYESGFCALLLLPGLVTQCAGTKSRATWLFLSHSSTTTFYSLSASVSLSFPTGMKLV